MLTKFKKSLVEWRPQNLSSDEPSEIYLINEEKAESINDCLTSLYYDLKNITVIFDWIIAHDMLVAKELGANGISLEVQHIIKLFIQRLIEDQAPIKRIVIEGFFKVLTLSDPVNSWELLSWLLIVSAEDTKNSELISKAISCFTEAYWVQNPKNKSCMLNSLCLATTQLIERSDPSSNTDGKILKIAKEILPLLVAKSKRWSSWSNSSWIGVGYQVEYLSHLMSLVSNNKNKYLDMIVPSLLPLIPFGSIKDLPHDELEKVKQNWYKIAAELSKKYNWQKDQKNTKDKAKQSQEYTNVTEFLSKAAADPIKFELKPGSYYLV